MSVLLLFFLFARRSQPSNNVSLTPATRPHSGFCALAFGFRDLDRLHSVLLSCWIQTLSSNQAEDVRSRDPSLISLALLREGEGNSAFLHIEYLSARYLTASFFSLFHFILCDRILCLLVSTFSCPLSIDRMRFLQHITDRLVVSLTDLLHYTVE